MTDLPWQAGSSPGGGSLDRDRPRGLSLRRVALGFALMTLLALAGFAASLGPQLVNIEKLAHDTRETVLPRIVAQQKRAIWTESLRSAANVVVFASDRAVRNEALAKAEQLADNMTGADDAANGELLSGALASIRTAAARFDAAQDLDVEILGHQRRADDVIGNMSANLASIVADSGATLAWMIEAVTGGDTDRRVTRSDLDEVLVMNTTSQSLLSSLDQGRILLAKARGITDDAQIDIARRRFDQIGTRLTARVVTLRGNTDYEYLPELIRQFIELGIVFDLRRQAIAEERAALEARTSATGSLAKVRESLAAGAATTAERSAASIESSARQIKLTALAAFVALVLVAVIIGVVGRRIVIRPLIDAGRAVEALEKDGEICLSPTHVHELEAIRRALDGFRQAQYNLEHLRLTVGDKLDHALRGALTTVASTGSSLLELDVALTDRVVRQGETAGTQEALPAGSIGPDLPAAPGSSANRGLTAGTGRHGAIHGVIGLIGDIAARTSLCALDATVAATGAADPKRRATDRLDLEMSADGDVLGPQIGAIRAATEQAIGTIESVGVAVNELNALVEKITSRVEMDVRDDVDDGHAPSGPATTAAGRAAMSGESRLGDTVHAVCSRIDRLQSELVRIRDLAPLRDAA